MTNATVNPKGLVFTVVAVASMMSIIGSLGAPLLGTIAQANHVTLSSAEWMLTATLLTGALATPVMGRLADGQHQRRVVLVALGICITGLVIAGLSHNFAELLVGRALQGLGMGLMPVTMAIASAHLDSATATKTVATLSVTAAVGVGLGYPVTSLIAEHFDYHAAFWFAGALVSASWALAYLRLPKTNLPKDREFDLWGSVLLTLSLIGLMSVLGEGQVWGWTSALSLGIGTSSVLLLLVWIKFEQKQSDPLVNFQQSKHRAVITADISAFLIAISMYLYIPIVVEYVQLPKTTGFGFGSSILTSGLLLLPLSIATFVSSRFVPMVAKHLNSRIIIPIGCAVFATGSGMFAVFNSALWQAFLSVGIAGFGAGFTFAAMPGYIVRSVPASETGGALGFYQLLRSIGLSCGSAVAGGILAFYTKHGASFPTLGGFRCVLITATGLLLVSMTISYFLLGDSGTGEELQPDTIAVMEENAELGATGFGLDPE